MGKTAKVKVNVTGADNYEDYTITVTLTVEAKLTPSPEGALTLSPAEITYGEKLGAIAISGTMQADGRTVGGHVHLAGARHGAGCGYTCRRCVEVHAG